MSLPNTDHVDERDTFSPIPKGDYRVVVESSEQKDSAKGFPMLNLTCVIIDGEHEGRKLFDMIILRHENEKAEEIGLRKLKQLKLATGKPDAREEHELWDIPVIARVTVEEDKSGQYGPRNRIQSFSPTDRTASAPKKAAESKPAATEPKRSWRK